MTAFKKLQMFIVEYHTYSKSLNVFYFKISCFSKIQSLSLQQCGLS